MLLRRRKLQCLFSRSGEDQGRRVVFFEDEICWSKAYCRHNFLVTCCILRNTTSDCAVILFNPVFKRYLFFAALGRMEMPVRQTFIWFVLLLAFVVNGPNLKLTRRFCFPLHAPTFYLRSVLKHQAIHWRKCVWSVTCRRSLQKLHLCTSPPWGCVEQTFAHISSMRLCGTNVCAHLLNQAVWNKLLRTSPWGCVEQTFAHISSMRLCGTNFCAHLLHEAVWNKLLRTSPRGCVEQTFAHIASMRLCGTNFCVHLLNQAVWNKLLRTSPPWGCVEQTFAHISSMRLCGTNFCTHLLLEAVWNKLLHTYPLSRFSLWIWSLVSRLMCSW